MRNSPLRWISLTSVSGGIRAGEAPGIRLLGLSDRRHPRRRGFHRHWWAPVAPKAVREALSSLSGRRHRPRPALRVGPDHGETRQVDSGGEEPEVSVDLLRAADAGVSTTVVSVASGERVCARLWAGWPGSRRASAGPSVTLGRESVPPRGGSPRRFSPTMQWCTESTESASGRTRTRLQSGRRRRHDGNG